MIILSFIACTDPCVYQKDGLCSLSRAASPGVAAHGGCVNFVPLASQQGGHGLPDVGHPDELQPLRGGQLALDPLGDEALGKAQPPYLG